MTRILWHTFGILMSAVFAMALVRLEEPRAEFSWPMLMVMAIGFTGLVRYVRWYRGA